jgi:hypothetical protein
MACARFSTPLLDFRFVFRSNTAYFRIHYERFSGPSRFSRSRASGTSVRLPTPALSAVAPPGSSARATVVVTAERLLPDRRPLEVEMAWRRPVSAHSMLRLFSTRAFLVFGPVSSTLPCLGTLAQPRCICPGHDRTPPDCEVAVLPRDHPGRAPASAQLSTALDPLRLAVRRRRKVPTMLSAARPGWDGWGRFSSQAARDRQNSRPERPCQVPIYRAQLVESHCAADVSWA